MLKIFYLGDRINYPRKFYPHGYFTLAYFICAQDVYSVDRSLGYLSICLVALVFTVSVGDEI